jgi:hypothetical protein
MKQYFVDKLTEINRKIESLRTQLVEYACDLNIKAITSTTDQLSRYKAKKEEFTRDAVKYLSVDDILTLLSTNLADRYTASYEYKYNKYITLSERERLVVVSYEFREARVK